MDINSITDAHSYFGARGYHLITSPVDAPKDALGVYRKGQTLFTLVYRPKEGHVMHLWRTLPKPQP